MDFPSPAQRRAKLFMPGDMVCPFGKPEFVSGIVVEVFPKIGMVDVEFPDRVTRYQADELRNLSNPQYFDPQGNVMQARKASAKKAAFDKSALYWAAPDRKYRATRDELPYGPYKCPRCKTEEGECVPMRKSTLQRTEGKNFKIWVCPSCTFAIQDSDVINCPVE
jgi:hypothetical protein